MKTADIKPLLQNMENLLEGNHIIVTFLGSGDNFGSGGRDQSCIHVASAGGSMLLDCGATVLVSMRKLSFDPGDIDAILISHLHGDHFGGLPFFILDAQLITRRTRPLLIAGPPGLGKRVQEAMEVFYPGSWEAKRNFDIQFMEIEPDIPSVIASFTVMPAIAVHGSGAPSYSCRIGCGEKVLGYSGDSEWCRGLLQTADGTDLFICEAYYFEKVMKNHLSYKTLSDHLDEIKSRKIILTHMGQDMLDRLDEVELETAYDGMQIVV